MGRKNKMFGINKIIKTKEEQWEDHTKHLMSSLHKGNHYAMQQELTISR